MNIYDICHVSYYFWVAKENRRYCLNVMSHYNCATLIWPKNEVAYIACSMADHNAANCLVTKARILKIFDSP